MQAKQSLSSHITKAIHGINKNCTGLPSEGSEYTSEGVRKAHLCILPLHNSSDVDMDVGDSSGVVDVVCLSEKVKFVTIVTQDYSKFTTQKHNA